MARGIGFRSVTFPEAIQLARILRNLLPAEREVAGLFALLLLVDARRDARTDDAGYLVLLADRDRI